MIATQEYWTFIFFAVYGVDGVLTIIHRIYLRENITAAHRKHAYQIMANELKIKHIYVELNLYAITIISVVWSHLLSF